MFIPDRIPDPTKATKDERKSCCPTFFVATNILNVSTGTEKKKFEPNSLRFMVLFTPKIVTKLSKI
jgi:hypothetical protein